jgi:hypothetical protein
VTLKEFLCYGFVILWGYLLLCGILAKETGVFTIFPEIPREFFIILGICLFAFILCYILPSYAHEKGWLKWLE